MFARSASTGLRADEAIQEAARMVEQGTRTPRLKPPTPPPVGSPRRVKLFLDCDGVLADFDGGAERVLGMPPKSYEVAYGTAAFWSRLENTAGFFTHLPLTPDARELIDGTKYLNPTILTGCPRGGWSQPQKLAWAERWFPGVPIICCRSAEKARFCSRGDVLVDDRDQYKDRWERAGGIFITHRSAKESLTAIRLLTE